MANNDLFMILKLDKLDCAIPIMLIDILLGNIGSEYIAINVLLPLKCNCWGCLSNNNWVGHSYFLWPRIDIFAWLILIDIVLKNWLLYLIPYRIWWNTWLLLISLHFSFAGNAFHLDLILLIVTGNILLLYRHHRTSLPLYLSPWLRWE